ncbi:DUF1496 domain-containing protein [Pseudoalteromonas sp. NEC-BIFX-2020_015]|uniref:DUF1496 domain-containing protein n=1 Tax=Pseudoalteromonas sp. NEC-BIFX-2020_015 TaxID=2729544 RepID=UPI00146161A3|nr:DUF1496 domain-containing protein [Pseudoalteromonas sp. NEC-BIFX-2020_015]NMR26859.1 DUF1496 domain-containing protein [Pseudoalteromonas sp. NEC-BIFX-2020_015]
MRILTVIGLCFISVIYSTNSMGNNQKATLLINPNALTSNQNICWFDDKRYSEGAIIYMSDTRVICTPKNSSQSNSTLSWLMLDEKGNVIYPKKVNKISIN